MIVRMSTLSLVTELLRHAPKEGFHDTSIPGLRLYRQELPAVEPIAVFYEPSICVIAQGSKRLFFGERTITYDPGNFLVSALSLPLRAVVPQASPERPFLGFIIRFDPVQVATLLAEIDSRTSWPEEEIPQVIEACPLNEALTRALSRLIRCLDDELDRQVLAGGLIREVLYEVLRGPKGHVLRALALRGGRTSQVARAVAFVEANFRQALDIGMIARRAAMSPSALHQHFKKLTALSPMQYVQQLRLHEARALLLSGLGVAEAGSVVGYNSPSQFSREFKRLFGVPPSQVPAA